jgi:hypothetical protein
MRHEIRASNVANWVNNNPYTIISVIKSRIMKWVGHTARMGVMRIAYNICSENLKVGDHPEVLCEYGRIILEW